MERTQGFIDLDKLLNLPTSNSKNKEKLKDLYRRVNTNYYAVVTKYRDEKFTQFNFHYKYNGEEYFYKYDSLVNPYNELIVEEIAKCLSIPCIDYDLAKVGLYYGTISKNYKVKDAKYITIYEILRQFYSKRNPNEDVITDDGIANISTQKDFGLFYNHLEGIWAALEDRYKDNSDMQEIVSRIMKKIVDIFVLDIITGQSDRHSKNLEVVEYPDGTIDLQPLFDNARVLLNDPFLTTVFLTVDNSSVRYIDDNIDAFRRTSSIEFVDVLLDSLWVINEENIKLIFERIKEKTGHEMPDDLKNKYFLKFETYRKFIMEELGIQDSIFKK